MKKLSMIFLALAMTLTPLSAQSMDAIQDRLIAVEMDYASSLGSGMSPENPKLQGMKSEIDAIGKIPDVRSQRYWDLLKGRKQSLEVDLAKQEGEGKGSQHPLILSIKAQLTAVDSLLKNKS